MAIKKIGFIGTGVMGSSMAKHLHEAGFEVSVYTRTKAKAQELYDQLTERGLENKGTQAIIQWYQG